MDGNRDAIRLNSVRRIDPHVSNIVDSANRTALYSYQEVDESWVKTDVEGTLMVYTRRAPPHNMVTIINRLNKSNFIEPLTTQCDIQQKSPYLLFRNTKGIIYGIWFSDTDDVQRISDAISEKMKEEVPSHCAVSAASAAAAVMTHPAVAVVGGVGGGDIMSMLSRAHGEFASKCQGQQQQTPTAAPINNDVVKPSPVRVQAGEQNTVADFFAKVSGATSGNMTGLGGGGPLASPSAPPGGIPQSHQQTTVPAVNAHNPVLQKLFLGAAAVGGSVQMPPSGDLTPSNPIPIPGAVAGPVGPAAGGGVGVPPAAAAAAAPISLTELEGRFKDNLRVGSHENQAQLQQQGNKMPHPTQQQQQHQQPPPHMHPSQGIHLQQPLQPQLQQQLYSVPLSQSDHPSLLSPQVFTTSRLAEGGSTPPTSDPLHLTSRTFPGLLTPGTAAALDMRPLNGSQESLHDFIMASGGQTVTPLTQEQLVQAFTLLLKKDDFVKQLHQAYVQVLNQSLKGCL